MTMRPMRGHCPPNNSPHSPIPVPAPREQRCPAAPRLSTHLEDDRRVTRREGSSAQGYTPRIPEGAGVSVPSSEANALDFLLFFSLDSVLKSLFYQPFFEGQVLWVTFQFIMVLSGPLVVLPSKTFSLTDATFKTSHANGGCSPPPFSGSALIPGDGLLFLHLHPAFSQVFLRHPTVGS